MLLIDGVKYELRTPPSEDEFEKVVTEHTQEIFGEQCVYFDRKQKLKSLSGIGSIPDGYAIILGDSPKWHIVEMELSSHPLHDHIVSQVSKFINGIKNPATQNEIAGAVYREITADDFLKLKVQKAIASTEIYKFLSELISKPPVLTIIIERDTQALTEAISTLAHPQIKVVEFQTFVRDGVGLAVHAHLFQPLSQAAITKIVVGKSTEKQTVSHLEGKKDITVKGLLQAGIIKPNQTIYRIYKGDLHDAIILANGKIKISRDGTEYDSLSAAAYPGITRSPVDGWIWWHTIGGDGQECKLHDLRNEYTVRRSSQSTSDGRSV